MKYNKFIDHTLLKQDATPEQIISLCNEAKQFDFMSVCVNPHYVPLAAEVLEGSDVKVCTVVGFPLGMNMTKTKIQETQLCIAQGDGRANQRHADGQVSGSGILCPDGYAAHPLFSAITFQARTDCAYSAEGLSAWT